MARCTRYAAQSVSKSLSRMTRAGVSFRESWWFAQTGSFNMARLMPFFTFYKQPQLKIPGKSLWEMQLSAFQNKNISLSWSFLPRSNSYLIMCMKKIMHLIFHVVKENGSKNKPSLEVGFSMDLKAAWRVTRDCSQEHGDWHRPTVNLH